MQRLMTIPLMLLCASVNAQLNDDARAAIDELAQTVQRAAALPSIVVLIDQRGETIYRGSFGTANLEHDLAADTDVPYAIGSITKSFTALAILKLVDEGRIDLSAPLSDYLPDYEGPARHIPVRHLLDHTSGIPNYTGFAEWRGRFQHERLTRDAMVATFASRPLEFEPGDKFSYSNSGYYLLGLIIEAVSGTDYYAYLSEQVFEPLGLTHTSSGNGSEIVSHRAGGYEATATGFVNHAFWSHLVPFSAGSLVATAHDLVRYRRGVFGGDAFSPDVQRLVTTTREMNDGTSNVYALGALIVSDFHGHAKLSHSGDIWGFTSNHAYYPDLDLTIVILANRQAEAPSMPSLEQKIARVVLGIEAPIVDALALPTNELAAYTGNYQLDPFIFGASVYGFSIIDGNLAFHFGGTEAPGPGLPLLAQGGGVFRAAFDDEWVFRFQAIDGNRMRMTADYRDGVFYGTRLAP